MAATRRALVSERWVCPDVLGCCVEPEAIETTRHCSVASGLRRDVRWFDEIGAHFGTGETNEPGNIRINLVSVGQR